MYRNSPRFFVLLIVIFIVLLVGALVGWMYLRNQSSPNTYSADVTISWTSSTALFTQQDQQGIQTALKSALITSNGEQIAGHVFTIIDAQRQEDWANFSVNEQVSSNGPVVAGEPLFFLAHVQNSNWNIWLPNSPDFCGELKQVPDTLLDSIDKHYFLGCYQ